MRKSLLNQVASLSLLAFCAFPLSLQAKETAPSTSIIADAELAEIRKWMSNPVVEISVSSQNRVYKDVSQEDIDRLDKQWRAERKADDQPLIATTLSSPLSSYLTQIQAASGGLFTEIFVMDSNGLNVGQSAITSDFWQGDEGKFQKTFPNGPDAVFIDEAEFHEGSKTWRTQINMSLVDKNNQTIGAVTVEYNLTELQRRKSTN
ncbi:hypothetical protein [Sneathiella limimaris]|uniref:hypothetical protein n=1 Tax=Sneathiella limimaris TaxID=1964213 RepID=UPI00146F760E|nr:hypothetical protein [Sneathiella limimaris]